MTTVVQTTYRPQIAFGLVGMPADGMPHGDASRVVETAAGIGFGLVVSQGVRDVGCIIGGTNVLGLTMRDTTLVRSPIDPLSSTLAPVDIIPQWANASIRSQGHLWVQAGGTVSAGDGLFYSTTTGALSGGATGLFFASGSVVFSSQPQAGQTVVLDGTTVTFVASGATGNQVNLGPTLGDTIVALAAMVNASADVNLTLLSTQAYPPSPGGAAQGSGANTLLVTSKAGGVAGNAYTLAAGTAPVTVSGATLAGGATAGTAINGAYWLSAAIAGQLAKVSLGIQR